MTTRPVKALVVTLISGALLAGTAGTANAASVEYGGTIGKCSDPKAKLVSRTTVTMPSNAKKQANFKMGQIRVYERTVNGKTTYCAAVAVRKGKTVKKTSVAIESLKTGGTMDSKSSTKPNSGAGMAVVSNHDRSVKVSAKVVGLSDTASASLVVNPLPEAKKEKKNGKKATKPEDDKNINHFRRDPAKEIPVAPAPQKSPSEGEHSGSRITPDTDFTPPLKIKNAR